MLPLCCFAFLSFLSPVLSIKCNETQYEWPMGEPRSCCEKCKPGEYLDRRNPHICEKTCKPCPDGRYTDTHNVEMYCGFCDVCTQPNMEYKSHCNSTHNAVCTCKVGYKCKDQSCKECLLVPATTTPPLPPSTTGLPTPTSPTPTPPTPTPPTPLRDTVWFLVIIVLLGIGFAFLVVTNIEPFLRWIRTKHGYFLAKPAAPVHSEDEEVSKPVQEVCGKCEQPLEV